MIDRRLAGAKSSSTGPAWFCLSRHMKTHFNFMPLLHTLFSSPPAPFHYHHSASFRNLQNLEDVNNSTVLQCFTAEVKPYGRVDNYHNRTHFSTAFYNSYFQSPTCNFSHTHVIEDRCHPIGHLDQFRNGFRRPTVGYQMSTAFYHQSSFMGRFKINSLKLFTVFPSL